jgi:hypothetical protein
MNIPQIMNNFILYKAKIADNILEHINPKYILYRCLKYIHVNKNDNQG